MAQPAPARARGGGIRKWAWLIGVAGVLVVGVAAVSVFAVQDMRNGYYIGEEGGQVVLYKGTTQELPLLDMSRKAPSKEQPNPPIAVADLPGTVQQKVKGTYEVNGPAAVEDLKGVVCKYSLVSERGKVVIVKGRGQQNCGQSKVKDTGLVLADLPDSDATAIESGKRAFIGLPAAENELARLNGRKNECKADRPSINDCPSPGGRS